jgi:signal recognition particle subunit SEC65
VCIYSPYLNRIKTIQEGRRIPVKNAVEDPTAWEILEVPPPRARPRRVLRSRGLVSPAASPASK